MLVEGISVRAWADSSEAADEAELLYPGMTGCRFEEGRGGFDISAEKVLSHFRAGNTCNVYNVINILQAIGEVGDVKKVGADNFNRKVFEPTGIVAFRANQTSNLEALTEKPFNSVAADKSRSPRDHDSWDAVILPPVAD